MSAPAKEAAPITGARLTALVRSIRDARVGGDFWAPPAASPGAATVIRARSPAAWARLRAGLGGAPAILCLPDAPWAHAVAAPVRVFGSVDPWSLLTPGVRLLAEPDDEWTLLAAIAGAETEDRDGAAADLGRRLGACAYRDPFAAAPATVEQVVAILAGWRRTLDANRPIAALTGISWWKREAIGRFLWCDRAPPPVETGEADIAVAAAAATGGIVATWPSRAPAGLAALAAAADVPVAAIEDGFIRSVGLGSDLHPPASIVVDRGGIYYDPARASDLETILATTDFAPDLLARAARLRETVVARGISKYASDAAAARIVVKPRGRRTVLVAGQVEDDMSVRAAGGAVAGNLDLVRRARAAEPDAHLIFRPHPDVDAGHRLGRVPDPALAGLADEVARGESMAALLARVDAVHVLTSQTGFEALLRGVETIVHGAPFYAGWGLTTDLAGPIPRRTRRLRLDELVAGVLILYPRYLDPETALPCPPEVLLERFASGAAGRPSPLIRARRLQGRIARLFGRVTG